ncbi:MAG: hypothetical protein ACPGVT_11280 [Maricaulaceae bacterium]
MTAKCQLCGQALGTDDPLSEDCGGDCWGCVSEIEARILGVDVNVYRQNPDKFIP